MSKVPKKRKSKSGKERTGKGNLGDPDHRRQRIRTQMTDGNSEWDVTEQDLEELSRPPKRTKTTHLLGHVPMVTTDTEHCVERIQCAGSPPPPSSHHRARTRTLVSWDPRHSDFLPSQTTNENHKSTNITIRDRWMTSVKTRRVYRYWYSSP